MGRKIPGKKHRGVKDPDKQRDVRFKSIKDKINAPPKNLDQNEIPKSLQRIMTFKERLKTGEVSLKRQRNRSKSKLVSSETKARTQKIKQKRLNDKKEKTPAFVQLPGENDRSFMRRVHTMVDNVIKESKFEEKFGVKVKRNLETGEVEDVIKQPKDELVELIKDIKKKEKNKGKKKKKKPEEPKLTKSQKKQRKLLEKKAKKLESKGDVLDFKDYKDTVSFGDIVHAPPVLNAPKKVIKLDCAPRPGQKDLLLKNVIKEGQKLQFKQPISTKKSVFDKVQSNKIDKKGKRKDLPNALRRQLENQRNEVVDAYRKIKAKKSVITV